MRTGLMVIAALALAGCGRQGQAVRKQQALNTFDVEEPSTASARSGGKLAAVPSPQIAYNYTVTYDFDRHGEAAVQERQLALCRQLGPQRCVVVKSTLSSPGKGEHLSTDQANLLVDARLAGSLNHRLDALATAGGASVAERGATAEDVTRQMIDTDARLRAKQALAARLLGVINGANGKVGELVEAERAYAATQEELDAARGEQAALTRRVAMSGIEITYAFDDRPGRDSPIGASVAAAGDTLAASVAALVTAVIAGLPWVLLAVAIVAAVRWAKRRRRGSLPPAP